MTRHSHSLQGIPDGKYREARRLRREMTTAECELWMHLRRNQVGGLHFRRQHVINGFIVDFFCSKAKLAVEVDGGIHCKQVEKDQIRDDVLRSIGIKTIRIPNQRIEESIGIVVSEIKEICLQRMRLLS